MVNIIGVWQESPTGGSRTRKDGAPADDRQREPECRTSENRRQEDPPHFRSHQRHEHTECDEPQAANVGKRTRGQIDPPRLSVASPVGGNEGGVLRKSQRTFLITLLERTDHDRKEHLPPEPASGLPDGKSLEQVTHQRLVIVDETVQKRGSHSWRIGTGHVRLSFI